MLQFIELSEHDRELLAAYNQAAETFRDALLVSLGVPADLYRGTLCLTKGSEDANSGQSVGEPNSNGIHPS